MKTNRKALLTSVISLLICVTMLIGTTFAWFTDTASTSVSKIQAGTLKVQLWSANVTNGQVGKSENVGNEEKAIFEEGILWEPGYTAYRVITIKNTGNLAFEFALDVTRETGATPTNLPEAIDAYYTVVDTAPTTIETGEYSTWNCEPTPLSQIIDLNDADGVVYGRILPANSTATPVAADLESKGEITVILALHMKETAGNEYMNKTEKFDIKVYAKQWTEEYDSEGNQYDANATYDETRVTPEPEEPACEHTNKPVKHNADGTHSYYCPDCETTLDEEVTTTYELEYSYNSNGQHTVSCTCEDMTPYTEACEPSTGTCAKCNNHTHNNDCTVSYTSNNNGTHKVTYTCSLGGVKNESEACVDNNKDHYCDNCSSEINITPATVDIVVETNTPGLTGVEYGLYDQNDTEFKSPLARVTADDAGRVTFSDFSNPSLKASQNEEQCRFYVKPIASTDVVFTKGAIFVYVNVSYDNENFKYCAEQTSDIAKYVSGYTKTVFNSVSGDHMNKSSDTDITDANNNIYQMLYTSGDFETEDLAKQDTKYTEYCNEAKSNSNIFVKLEKQWSGKWKFVCYNKSKLQPLAPNGFFTFGLGDNGGAYGNKSVKDYIDTTLEELIEYAQLDGVEFKMVFSGNNYWGNTPIAPDAQFNAFDDNNSEEQDVNFEITSNEDSTYTAAVKLKDAYTVCTSNPNYSDNISNFTVQVWCENFKLFNATITVPTPTN